MPTPSVTCCPGGSYYVNGSGIYIDATGNYVNIINTPYSTPSYANSLGKCAQFYNKGFADGLSSPSACPCCPEGYTWVSFINICLKDIYLLNLPGFPKTGTTPSVPCIPCNCVTVPDPTCTTCGTGGLGVNFSWDFTKSNCTTCPPQETNNPPGGIQSFLSSQYLDPVTSTFVLRNKNFI